MHMRELVKIPVSREVREALKALKRGGESYDDVARRLIGAHVKPIFEDLAEWLKPILEPILEAEG